MREREQPGALLLAMAPGRRHFELHHPVRVKLLLRSTADKGERKRSSRYVILKEYKGKNVVFYLPLQYIGPSSVRPTSVREREAR